MQQNSTVANDTEKINELPAHTAELFADSGKKLCRVWIYNRNKQMQHVEI